MVHPVDRANILDRVESAQDRLVLLEGRGKTVGSHLDELRSVLSETLGLIASVISADFVDPS